MLISKKEDFWNKVKIGDEYIGTVSSLCSYGAFIDVDGNQGLLNIPENNLAYVRDAKTRVILKQGQKIKVIIKELDRENKRMQLVYSERKYNSSLNCNKRT